jgi:hypothetical protein
VNFWKKLRGAFNSEIALDPPSPQELFMAEVEMALREVPGVTSIAKKPDEFALEVCVRDETRMVFLGAVFQESRTMSPEERRQHVQAWFVDAHVKM